MLLKNISHKLFNLKYLQNSLLSTAKAFTALLHIFKVGVKAIVGVTELKAEFAGILDLHKRC